MADIFISYASDDRDKIFPIVKALAEQSWSLFWDWTSIPVGKTWRQLIEEGLGEAKCVMAFSASETFDVVVDLGSPVSLDYFDRRPFAFIGKIEKVEVNLK
jgi:hypothetical protein